VNCEDAAALSEMGDEARRRVEALIDDNNVASSAGKRRDVEMTSRMQWPRMLRLQMQMHLLLLLRKVECCSCPC